MALPEEDKEIGPPIEFRLAAFCYLKIRELTDNERRSMRSIADAAGVTHATISEVLSGAQLANRKVENGLAAMLFDGSVDALREAADEAWKKRRCLWHSELAEAARIEGDKWTEPIWRRVLGLDALVYDDPPSRAEWLSTLSVIARGRRPTPARPGRSRS